MVRRRFNKNLSLLRGALLVGLSALSTQAHAATLLSASFLYTLSNFTGAVTYNGGSLFVDRERNESYMLYQNVVSVYNGSGLEIYRFTASRDLGLIRDLAVTEDGSILLLSSGGPGAPGSSRLIQCDFRGDPRGDITLSGLPSGFGTFHPDRLDYRNGRIYLADSHRLLAVIADAGGRVERSFDLFALLELDEKDRANAEMDGFSVDKDGNMLFTLPVLFTAFRVYPDGTASSFGEPGSIPGKFGVVSGITTDNQGNILVADKLKCVISIFDRNFKFLREFGHRGNEPGNLIIPQDLAVDSNDRVYVVQAGNRGVSVFRLHYAN